MVMTASDEGLDKILCHGPSAGFLAATLEKMKAEGRLNEVIQQCIRFLDLYPDDLRLRTLLAQSYAEVGFLTLAEYEFKRVATLLDGMTSVYRWLADLYGRQQRYQEAADMLRRYLAHHPQAPEALAYLKEMEAALTPEKALTEMGDLEGDLVPSEDTLVDFATPTIAELYYSQGRIDAAIHTYERLLEERPGDEAFTERLIQLKGMLGGSPESQDQEASTVGGREEIMITILERWLPRIREIPYAC
jgi:tetratricopeptide (TPR) repeat protein